MTSSGNVITYGNTLQVALEITLREHLSCPDRKDDPICGQDYSRLTLAGELWDEFCDDLGQNFEAYKGPELGMY